MKRVLAMVFSLAAVSCASVALADADGDAMLAADTTSMEAASNYAPADEYFGPTGMSVLGIRNSLNDLPALYAVHPWKAEAIYGKALLVEASLHDWEKKYPLDPDLAKYVYQLSHLYQKIDLAESRKKGLESEFWLLSRYPSSWYAQDEQRRIAARNAMHEDTEDADTDSVVTAP